MTEAADPEVRADPVCGMPVRDPERTTTYRGDRFWFCSELCQRTFLERPARYAGAAAAAPAALLGERRIAYFSMEVALEEGIPTYSGGLGVLAGDALRSAADLGLPVIGVSLLYRNGYFDQTLDAAGSQHELPVSWEPSARRLRLLPATVEVAIRGHPVAVRAWQYDIEGVAGHSVPVILLDTDTEPNAAGDRNLTSALYEGDESHRLAQEAILGIGGIRMLRALGCKRLDRFHLNEGHAALLALELLREGLDSADSNLDFASVRSRCVFTTHTPVPAGHDQFTYPLVREVLGEPVPAEALRMLGGVDRLNMTLLAMNLSHYVNGVAKRHGEVSHEMFPAYPIDSITNGVHSLTWTCDSFRRLYDRHMAGWTRDPFTLRHATKLPQQEVWQAHAEAKGRLLAEIRRRSGLDLDPEALTIGFARRAAVYKRSALVFHDLDQLAGIARDAGPLQFVFAGKAHPRDDPGKEQIRRLFEASARLRGRIPLVYLENYDLELARLLTAGVDLWLNTPLRPLEASGTSGMKAAHNGVPSLSVLDGWWIEGHIEGVTGWSIGTATDERGRGSAADDEDARDLYGKLGGEIAPVFYRERGRWVDVMRQTIAVNGSYFNTHRMIQQYAASAYV